MVPWRSGSASASFLPPRRGATPWRWPGTPRALGFDFVSVWDHLHGDRPSYETWTLLTWIAASTERIGVATNVLGLPYRAPAVLAKMAETLDRLSGGRLILGLGAGGSDEEFRAFGVPDRSPGEKVEALEEALRILRGLWTGAGFSFEGRHYRVRPAEIEPQPEHPIPVWVGAYGPRALRLTGRLADGWIPSMPYAPPGVVAGMLGRVREAAAAAGRDPDGLTYAYNVSVRIGDGTAVPNVVTGTPEQVTEELEGLLRMGFTALNFWLPDREEQRERLARDVVRRIRRDGPWPQRPWWWPGPWPGWARRRARSSSRRGLGGIVAGLAAMRSSPWAPGRGGRSIGGPCDSLRS